MAAKSMEGIDVRRFQLLRTSSSLSPMKRQLLLFLLVMPAFAQCTGYGNSKTVDIARIKIPSTQNNFTILISGTWSFLANTSSGGLVANMNGYDICFSDSPNTLQYSYDRFETYDNTTGQIAVWVGPIPTVNGNGAASDTQIKLWYGNPSVNTFQGVVPEARGTAIPNSCSTFRTAPRWRRPTPAPVESLARLPGPPRAPEWSMAGH